MERRDFLQLLAAAALPPVLKLDAKPSPGKGMILICLEDKALQRTIIRKFNWSTHESTDFVVPIACPHSVVQDLLDRNIVYVFEVFGSAARFDLYKNETLKIDHREGKEISYGHGLQAESGRLLCTQHDMKTKRGFIVAKEAKTMKTIERLPKECEGAHQIAQIPGTKTFVCGVAGNLGVNQGAVTFFDSEKAKTVLSVPLPSSIIHVFPISSSEVVALGIATPQESNFAPKFENSSKDNQPDREGSLKYLPAPIYLVKTDGSVKTFADGGRLDDFKFNFSFAKVPGTELLITTHVGSSRVIVWKDSKPLKVITLPFPTNVKLSADASEFMVITAGTIKIFSVATLQETKTLKDSYTAVGFSAYAT